MVGLAWALHGILVVLRLRWLVGLAWRGPGFLGALTATLFNAQFNGERLCVDNIIPSVFFILFCPKDEEQTGLDWTGDGQSAEIEGPKQILSDLTYTSSLL